MITEKAFMQQVIDLAHLHHWKVYHPFDSRRSCPGFPDLVLCHPTRGFLMAELKTERGRLSPAQMEWMMALANAGIECHMWRPGDFDAIVQRLAVAA